MISEQIIQQWERELQELQVAISNLLETGEEGQVEQERIRKATLTSMTARQDFLINLLSKYSTSWYQSPQVLVVRPL